MGSLKRQAVSGVFWTFAQQFSVQLINFGVQIILARLLLPDVFGLIAMLSIFIAIGQMLMDGGMTSSIIRTKRPDQQDYSTVFVTNLLMSCFIYILIFFSAPLIASFYDQPVLLDIVRVYSLTFVIRSLVAVHVAKLTKEMNFKLQMRLQVPSTICGAIVGVILAYSGYGVWSLVWLNLTQTILFTLQHWLFIKWKPSLSFNKRRFRYHFNFGYKMTLAGLLDTIYNNAYNIVIGKFFSATLVGYYSQADTMRLLPVNQLSTVMGKVTYPLFSNIKEDEGLKRAYKTSMRLVLFVVVPMMILLIEIADPVFLFLFGDKWLPAAPYFQILAIASIVRPLGTYNLNILKVKGRSDMFLRLEVVKKVIGVLAIVVSLPFGILPLIYSLSVTSILFAFLNAYYSGNLINYRIKEQMEDIYKIFICALIAASLTYLALPLIADGDAHLSKILVSSCIYLTTYIGSIYVLDKPILLTIKNLIGKRNV